MRGRGGGWRQGEAFALAALVFLLVVTALWWALALWPTPGAAPQWLQTTRAVCFGASHAGLPDTGGWILLVGEPLGMLAALYVVWRDPLVSGVRGLAASRPGRGILALLSLLVVMGMGAAGWRVASAYGGVARPSVADVTAAPGRPLDRPAPALRLVDQHGDTLTLDRFAGRAVLVAFAYAHCETVCPLVVQGGLDVQRRLGDAAPALVVVTLDPWRDIPTRLPHIASAWGLGPDAFVVSGKVTAVEQVLQNWGVESVRDLRTGEVIHAPVVFVVDARGWLAHATNGSADEVVKLLGTLASRRGRAVG